MRTQLDIGNEKLTIGDKCIITIIGNVNGLGPTNTLFSVWGFKQLENGRTLIGLYSPIHNIHWGSLDGNVLSGHGLWVNVSSFIEDLHLMSKKYEIHTKYSFKNQDLKSMECKILYDYDENNVFVEMDENIGGSNCDGLSKTGHCIILPRSSLGKTKSKKMDKK